MIERASIITNKFILVCVALLFITIPAIANDPNSEEDPYLINPEDRSRSEMPVPYGFIIDMAYPVAIMIEGDFDSDYNNMENNSSLPFELMYYYDSWQFGICSNECGNTARLMFRDIGRDAYSSYFIEMGYGWEVKEKYEVENSDGDLTGESKIRKEAPLIIGFGGKSQSGFNKGLSFAYYSEWLIGYRNDDNFNNFMYAHFQLGLGMRIPINTMSIYVQGGAVYGLATYTDSYKSDSKSSLSITTTKFMGLQLKVSYSINYNDKNE